MAAFLGVYLLTVLFLEMIVFAGAKHQERTTSKLTGGTGIQRTIVRNTFSMA
jgi:hypothetical protein